MSKAHEGLRQDVKEKPSNELVCLQGQHLDAIVATSVPVGKGHTILGDVEDSVVRDGDTVCVSSEVIENRFGSAERWLAIDDPGLLGEPVEEAREGHVEFEELQLLLFMEVSKSVEELAAKDLAQCFDWEEESGIDLYPAIPTPWQCSSRDDGVDMEVGAKRLVPGVKDHRESQLSAQVVAAEFQEGLTGGSKEQVEKSSLVRQDDRVELVGQGEDIVEVRNGEEFALAILEPPGLGQALAFWTVSIAT